MGKGLSNEDRQRIIDAYHRGMEEKEIALLFQCHKTTIGKIVKLYQETGRVEALPRGGIRAKKLSEIHHSAIQGYIREDCGISLREMQAKIQAEFSLSVSQKTIDRAISDFNWSLKRTTAVPERRNTDDVIGVRCEYALNLLTLISKSDGENIYFIDEVGFNLSMRIKRGRSPVGTRATQIVTNLRTKNYSVACTMSKRGTFYYDARDSAFNAVKFEVYIRDLLAKFRENDINTAIL
ncbi:hypothetical protein ENBRE01_2334 [Enteropsectra breve]|nr:hypothetical protein ENBRE01_2334 [Enteropsectra breve]